jgi:D-alanyl-lipoteichoic acid acyltransferase DltB (MBOAT superfamily)
MDSASFEFILFGLVVAILANLNQSPRWRSAVLLVASIVFLGLLSPGVMQVAPLAGFLLLGYLGYAATRRSGGKQAAVSIGAVVIAYLWLKKYAFLPHGLFLNFPYLALGLSYIFFRVLHLIIESEDAESPKPGLAGYVAYTLNFTTLVSGPIQRYNEFAADLFAEDPIGLDIGVIATQLERIIRGFFKVNVLALLLNIVHNDALSALTRHGVSSGKLLAAFELVTLYPFFLYCNFSGYIDIVIALARLMRIRLPENFDRPFSASSFIDFWNRWHITLSLWLRTYVYNPLLIHLSRRFVAPSLQSPFAVLSLFVTFFLVGIWHGRTSEFALFGVLQGGGVAVNLMWQLFLIARMGRKRYRALSNGPVYEAVGRGLTFTWFAFTLSWFWADWSQLEAAYAGLGTAKWLGVWAIVWLVSTMLLTLFEWLRKNLLSLQAGGTPMLAGPPARMVWTTAMVFVWFVIGLVISQPAPDIVYKAF